MLYKFKSKITGDLIMLQPNGQRILDIIGKETNAVGGDKGILLPHEMPAAIAALQMAISQDEVQRKAAQADALEDKKERPVLEAVSLRQRATPFIEMLRRCAKEDVEIVWGV